MLPESELARATRAELGIRDMRARNTLMMGGRSDKKMTTAIT